jgi:mRNA-degrading endonuclease RelE of RelBE toxin-antitoxin system
VGSKSDREKLAGYADRYRVGQGDYREVHPIDEEASVVTIYKIGH